MHPPHFKVIAFGRFKEPGSGNSVFCQPVSALLLARLKLGPRKELMGAEDIFAQSVMDKGKATEKEHPAGVHTGSLPPRPCVLI